MHLLWCKIILKSTQFLFENPCLRGLLTFGHQNTHLWILFSMSFLNCPWVNTYWCWLGQKTQLAGALQKASAVLKMVVPGCLRGAWAVWSWAWRGGKKEADELRRVEAALSVSLCPLLPAGAHWTHGRLCLLLCFWILSSGHQPVLLTFWTLALIHNSNFRISPGLHFWHPAP